MFERFVEWCARRRGLMVALASSSIPRHALGEEVMPGIRITSGPAPLAVTEILGELNCCS